MVSTDPEHIAISKSKGITIDWKDGHASSYGLDYLRENCPCATCTGANGTPPTTKPAASAFPRYKPTLKVLEVESVGNYPIPIMWGDGHTTKIYSFHLFPNPNPLLDCPTYQF